MVNTSAARMAAACPLSGSESFRRLDLSPQLESWVFSNFSINSPLPISFLVFLENPLEPLFFEKTLYKLSSRLGFLEDFWRPFVHLLPLLRELRRSFNFGLLR